MSLTPGLRLGPYEIQSPLGSGGMGEVYKARDTRPDRIVAIKVLPAHVASDPNFRDRFEREAKVISQLDHPHICALYDVGEAPNPESRPTPDSRFPTPDKIQFLVMQYLEGETLADRLVRGSLPVDHALLCAIQIADALDKAHRQGIVHRDLKPGNIFLCSRGSTPARARYTAFAGSAGRGRYADEAIYAKLLDFGLAKTGGPLVAGAGLSMLPTTPPHLTAQGTILGTFQYMAPEQLEGKDADARTDIFAFGAVLYETLTGKRAFEGKTQASLIHAIMGVDPPAISTVQPVVPQVIDRIVKTCLAKDPDDRWQSARDLLRELKWVAEGSSQAVASTAGTHPASAATAPMLSQLGTRERAGWITLAIAGIAIAVSALSYFRTPAQDVSPVQFAVPRPEKTSFSGAGYYASIPSPSLSEDGRRLAFVAVGASGTPSLCTRFRFLSGVLSS